MDETAPDQELHNRIDALVAEEHALRAHNDITDEDRSRLSALEVGLDRAWDLLRQRAALRDVGKDPSGAAERSDRTVEGYLN